MPNAGFGIGDRVTRVMDGAVGVVTSITPGGDVGVRWDASGHVQLVVPALLKKI